MFKYNIVKNYWDENGLNIYNIYLCRKKQQLFSVQEEKGKATKILKTNGKKHCVHTLLVELFFGCDAKVFLLIFFYYFGSGDVYSTPAIPIQ